MRIHFVVHEAFEAPGAYETWAKSHHHTLTYSRVYQGDLLPGNIGTIDFLIVMGGPQDPHTTKAQCAHFDTHAEQQLIKQAINAGRVVLGICLGAQLIGEALGATYAQSPEREIGKFPITLTEAGIAHPLINHFGNVLEVGHWHNDMPGLTADAQILAYSEGCPRQIIAYSDRVFGFQCHMEFTTDIVAMLIANDTPFTAAQHRFVETPSALLNHDFTDMNQRLYTFLDKLEKLYQAFINKK
ncbi:glutamine amidotransferase-related protein [Alishewanella tabrizica]|uniref:GMP synthase n=1 Tax=Alishewanella tabrizica TaxID=671278 RepID=A0ABQ2WDJ6_9ALTE|nr:gamma-glutamyl-gamma-aminobutyrate hydrolase family protein [Alishewanella tabrizica]GGW49858.1 GMP synthase [Alishewanella tabrizica]